MVFIDGLKSRSTAVMHINLIRAGLCKYLYILSHPPASFMFLTLSLSPFLMLIWFWLVTISESQIFLCDVRIDVSLIRCRITTSATWLCLPPIKACQETDRPKDRQADDEEEGRARFNYYEAEWEEWLYNCTIHTFRMMTFSFVLWAD